MPVPAKGLKKTVKSLKAGRSIEEVILKRRLDIDNPLTWPPGQNTSLKALNPASRSVIEVFDAVLNTNITAVVRRDDEARYDNQEHVNNKYLVLDSNDKRNNNHHENQTREYNSMANYCQMLRYRIKELEEMLAVRAGPGYRMRDNEALNGRDMSTRALNVLLQRCNSGTGMGIPNSQNSSPHTRDDNRQNPFGRDRNGSRTQVPGQIGGSSNSNRVNKINGDRQALYYSLDPVVRVSAASRISGLVRGYLTRCRTYHYRSSLLDWKKGRCRHATQVIELMLAGQSELDSRIDQKRTGVEARLLRAVFFAWLGVAQRYDLHRREKGEVLHAFVRRRHIAILKSTFVGLREGTVGLKSSKWAAIVRRQVGVVVRQQLSDKLVAGGQSGVVLDTDFRLALHRHLVEGFSVKRWNNSKRRVFNALVSVISSVRMEARVADKHWFKVRVSKCFFAWSEWNFLVSAGLDRKRWKSARHYEVRYNSRRLDYFSKMRQLKIVWYPWKARHLIMCKVKLKQKTFLTRFVSVYFQALREITGSQRKLRWLAVDSWKGYATLMMGKPFQAWAGLVHLARSAINEKIRLAFAYRRWKTRQFHIMILRTWRHQALFGRTDGMYTRAMLLSGLKSQKALSGRLEKLMVAQTVELEECKEIIDKEISKRFEQESKLYAALGEIQKHKIFSHHAQQEVKRVETIVEMMALINPRQVEHLQKMQPSFRFKERSILASNFDPLLIQREGQGQIVADGGVASRSAATSHEPIFIADSGLEVSVLGDVEKNSKYVKSSIASGTDTGEKCMKNSFLEVSTNEEEVVPHHTELSKADMLLLDRAKWLVTRYCPSPGEGNEASIHLVPQSCGKIIDTDAVHGEKKVLDRGRSSSLIPSVSPVAERIRIEEEVLPTESSLAEEGWELHQLATKEGRTTAKASHMLLSFVDFLCEGDVSLFSCEDRRLWTKSVLSSVLQDREEEARLQQDALDVSKSVGRPSTATGSTDIGAELCDILSDTEIKAGAQELESHTWRQTLIQLRTMFPGGGNYSGVGVPLDMHDNTGTANDGNSIYTRLLEMRETQDKVMRSKVRRKDQHAMKEFDQNLVLRPPNIYAGNLEAELADGDSDSESSLDNNEDLFS